MAVRIPLGGRGERGPEAPDEIDVREPVRFEELWELRDALHRVCERIVGDPVDADDLVQETYLRALARIDELDRRESFLPWLATVARHRGIDELRRRRFSMPTDDVPEKPERPSTPDPLEAVVTSETLERVREAMAKLTPRERRLLMAQVHRSLTLSELAEEDGSTVASVRSVLTRARSKLRSAVGEIWLPVAAPLAATSRWWRRRMADLQSRSASTQPAAVDGIQRLGELMTAAVASAALVAPVGTPVAGPDPASSGEASAVRSAVVDDGHASMAERHTPPSTRPSTVVTTDTAEAVPPPPPTPLRNLIAPGSVDEPEQARITGFSAASDGRSGSVLAVGRRPGPCARECLVLFRSLDGGRSWERLAARGMTGPTVMAAPSYPDDPRVVALGAGGLSVSRDGGTTFAPVATQLSGSEVAMSPGFSESDPRLLLGGDPAWTYDDRTETAVPLAGLATEGWRASFSFDPAYADSGLLLAGGAVHGEARTEGAVFRCERQVVGDVCSDSVVLPGLHEPPSVSIVPWNDTSAALAWGSGQVFVSHDGARSFERVPGLDGATLAALTHDGAGTIYGAVSASRRGRAGVIRSTDGGRTWTTLGAGTPLESGVAGVAVVGSERLLAAPVGSSSLGLFCSTDAGATWAARCS